MDEIEFVGTKCNDCGVLTKCLKKHTLKCKRESQRNSYEDQLARMEYILLVFKEIKKPSTYAERFIKKNEAFVQRLNIIGGMVKCGIPIEHSFDNVFAKCERKKILELVKKVGANFEPNMIYILANREPECAANDNRYF